jgi:O-antigen/teichoic acid export membrane protein
MRILMSFRLRDHVKRWWRSAMLMGILGNGIRFGANLLLLPLVLTRLSSTEYATWVVFIALGNFANLADFGFGAAIPRVYSYLWAGAEDFDTEGMPASKGDGKPNFERIRQLNATAHSLYLKLSLGAMFLLAVGGSAFLVRSADASGIPQRIWWLWALFLIAIAYNLATSYWVLACQGLNLVRKMEIAAIFSGLGYVCCTAILLFMGAGLLAMIVATFLKGVIMREKCRRACRQAVPPSEQKVGPHPEIIKKLWPNAYKFGILSIGAYLVMNGPVLICRWFLGEKTTASFGLTSQVVNFLTSFAILWLTVKWPEIAILRMRGRLEEMAALFARRLSLVMASFIALALVVFFAGNVILEWKGTHTRLLPRHYLAFYFIYIAQQIFYIQFGTLTFTENVMPLFKVSLFTGLGVIACGLIMTPLFGLWGLVIAPFMVEMSYCSWFTVWRGFQGQPLSLRRFCRAMFFRTL